MKIIFKAFWGEYEIMITTIMRGFDSHLAIFFYFFSSVSIHSINDPAFQMLHYSKYLYYISFQGCFTIKIRFLHACVCSVPG